MRWNVLVVTATSLLAMSAASAQSPRVDRSDQSYAILGDARIQPTVVFNDGHDTFVQPHPSQVKSMRVLDVPYARQGNYLIVPGVHAELKLEHRGAVATARRADDNAQSTIVAKTDCAQTSRTEQQEYEVVFRAQRAQPQRAFQNKLKRIVTAALNADSVTIITVPESADRLLAEQRARHLRDLLIARGVSPEIIALDTQFRARTGSQIVIRRSVQSCGDSGSDAETTALVRAGPVYGARVAYEQYERNGAKLFYGHGSAAAHVASSASYSDADVSVLPVANKVLDGTSVRAAHSVKVQLLAGATAKPDTVISAAPVSPQRRLTFAPNSSVRDALRRYLRDEAIELDWQVSGDLIVEEYADVSGGDTKAVITNALRRLGLKGTLIAGRRLVVESAS